MNGRLLCGFQALSSVAEEVKQGVVLRDVHFWSSFVHTVSKKGVIQKYYWLV
jgi:hypothetical protein